MRANEMLALAAGARKVAYIDLVRIWLTERPTKSQLRGMRSYCGMLKCRRSPMKYQPRWRCRLALHQPTETALHLLGEMIGGGCLITYVEFALDLVPTEYEMLDALRAFVDHTMTIPVARGRQSQDVLASLPKDVGRTLYFRRRVATRNVVVYSDRPSKMLHQPCVHVEFRMRSTQLRKLGISGPGDLLAFDHREFWRQRLNLASAATSHDALGRAYAGVRDEQGSRGAGCDERRAGAILMRTLSGEDGHPQAQRCQDAIRCWPWIASAIAFDHLDNQPCLPSTGEITRESPVIRKEGRRGGAGQHNPSEPKLSDELWSLIQPLLPRRQNTHKFGGGRPRKDDRACMMAILHRAKTGCSFGDLAALGMGCSSTIQGRMKEWADGGLFRQMRQELGHHEDLAGMNWSKLGIDGGGGYSDR